MTDKHKILLDDYLKNEALRGHTIQGLRRLRTGLPRFFEYLEEMGLDVRQVRFQEAGGYQKWLIEKGRKKDNVKYRNGTIQWYMRSAVNFYKFLKRKKIIFSNPFLEVRILRGDLKVPRNLLKEKGLSLLLNELSHFENCKGNMISKITRYKAHVACELMYASGLRSSETANLRVSDIDFDNSLIRVVEGKGGVSRMALLNDYAKNILGLYVNQMRDVVSNNWNKKNDTLFGIGWERFNKVINEILNEACKKLKLGNFRSHCFRHSVGYHMLRSGCDIRYIQAILGHKKLSSTEIYTRVDKEDLKEVLNKYHPRTFFKKVRDKPGTFEKKIGGLKDGTVNF